MHPSFRPLSRNLLRKNLKHRATETQRLMIIKRSLCYSVSLCLFREIKRSRSRIKSGMRGIKPAMKGIGAAKTILPPRWGSLFYRIQRGLTPPPMFCRPYRANHKSAFYITGVHTPAYVLSPLQGYIIFHYP